MSMARVWRWWEWDGDDTTLSIRLPVNSGSDKDEEKKMKCGLVKWSKKFKNNMRPTWSGMDGLEGRSLNPILSLEVECV